MWVVFVKEHPSHTITEASGPTKPGSAPWVLAFMGGDVKEGVESVEQVLGLTLHLPASLSQMGRGKLTVSFWPS